MKKLKQCIFILVFAFIVVSLIQPAEAKKFDQAVAKKKISVVYKKAPNGVLAIYKNKNKFPVKINSTMKFLDSDKKSLSKETQINYCLGGNSTGAFFFMAPLDECGELINYTSYKCTYSVSKSKYKSYSQKISVSSELQTISGNFAAINLSNKNLSTIHVTIVFYDSDDHIVLCKNKNLNCFEKNSIDQFTIDYIEYMNQPQKVKVYVNWAY